MSKCPIIILTTVVRGLAMRGNLLDYHSSIILSTQVQYTELLYCILLSKFHYISAG